MEKKKLFAAIPLSDSFKTSLTEIVSENNLPGRITPLENLHITLQFFGQTESKNIPEIIDGLTEIAQVSEIFSLVFKGLKLKKGFHPMIWAVFFESIQFRELALKLRIRFDDPDRRFVPHITLSRLKEKISGFDWQLADPFPELQVTQFELWESKVSSAGAVYSSLKVFPLAQSPDSSV